MSIWANWEYDDFYDVEVSEVEDGVASISSLGVPVKNIKIGDIAVRCEEKEDDEQDSHHGQNLPKI